LVENGRRKKKWSGYHLIKVLGGEKRGEKKIKDRCH